MKRALLSIVIVAAAVGSASRGIEAHKPVTSKYTYNQDVFPIVREKCGSCHRPGGVAPMSLMTYEDAFPWSESIRIELIAGHMPPAIADPTFGSIQHNQFLTAHETDVILTWATGGNPRGSGMPAAPLNSASAWALGTPDLLMKLPEMTLPPDKSEETREFALEPHANARWIRAVDVHPGTASVIRNVSISVKSATVLGSPLAAEQVLCRWIPGQVPTDASQAGAAFALPAGAKLIARVHYKKTWRYDGKAVTDDSAIGLYFAGAAIPQKLLTLPLDAPKLLAAGSNASYAVEVPDNLSAFNLRVDHVPADVTVDVEALQADGTHVPMVRFAGRPDWERRYWFRTPVRLTRGSRIQVRATYRDPALVADAFGGVNHSATAEGSSPLQMSLDVTAANAARSKRGARIVSR